MKKYFALAGLIVASLIAAPSAARASSITYDFTGTLTCALNGNNTVTGFFTLDNSGAGAITAYSFTEPDGVFNTSNGGGGVLELQATNPNTTFVDVFFQDFQ